MIDKFYGTYFEHDAEKIQCYYNDVGIFIGDVYIGDEIVNEYIFDSNTGFAVGWDQLTVDFIDNEYIEFKANLKDEYEGNYRLAIGYVLDSNRDEFVRNNFYNDHVYSSLETIDNNDDSYYSYLFNSLEMFDYRIEESKNNGTENCFVIIPKSEEVKDISVY